MDIRISREVGHAHVAAVRVLQYRQGRPPTPDEIAEVLGSKVELTTHRLRALQAAGIVTLVENPFETHVSVRDHLALDQLPQEVSEEGLSDAVAEFKKRQTEKAGEMIRLFEESDEKAERKDRADKHATDLSQWKPKKSPKAPWEE
jgi:DNA-directed RNA polymerase specialized sigma subunit